MISQTLYLRRLERLDPPRKSVFIAFRKCYFFAVKSPFATPSGSPKKRITFCTFSQSGLKQPRERKQKPNFRTATSPNRSGKGGRSSKHRFLRIQNPPSLTPPGSGPQTPGVHTKRTLGRCLIREKTSKGLRKEPKIRPRHPGPAKRI